MVINIHSKDVEILNHFKQELRFEGELHFYKGKNIKRSENYQYVRNDLYRLTVSSNLLCNNLIRLGCLPRKTFICKFPNSNQVHDF